MKKKINRIAVAYTIAMLDKRDHINFRFLKAIKEGDFDDDFQDLISQVLNNWFNEAQQL